MEKINEKKRKLQFPNTYVLLFLVATAMALLSYIVPAGTFERVLDEATGRTEVVPDSFSYVESTPATLKVLFSSVYVGFMDCVDIIALLIIMGATIGILIESGAFHAVIAVLVRKLGAKTDILFAIMMCCFAIASSIVGMAEELIIFVPLIVTVCRALHYDDLTACAVLILGLYSSLGFSPISPYNLVIAQTIAKVPIYSGMSLRLVGMVGGILIGIAYVLRYSRKCAKNPEKSLLYDKKIGGYIINNDLVEDSNFSLDNYELTKERKIILLLFTFTIVLLVAGVILYGWYLEEMSAIFLVLGIICGLIHFRGNINTTADELVKQAAPLIGTAILLALSRSIVYIITEAQIMDTFIYWLPSVYKGQHA